MSQLEVKSRSACMWDLVALGEVMLRLDPGDRRVTTARSFEVWEGGGEYNVARSLRCCFGLNTALVTAFADNPVGHLLETLIRAGGVDQRHVAWVPYDGVGRAVRNGLNFTERGFGVRAGVGCSDRGHTAASQLKEGDVPWRSIFGDEGVRWFHTGGIFAALSDSTLAVAKEAMRAAQAAGTVVSYDLNYRASLWRDHGGTERARAVNRELIEFADVLVGSEEDYPVALEGSGPDFLNPDSDAYTSMLMDLLGSHRNLKLAAVTVRRATTASRNDWGAICCGNDHVYVAPPFENLEIFDRVGGGDSFASGFFYGLLSGTEVERAVRLGVAHGALAMTTPGDTSMVTLAEVEALVEGGGARISR